METQSPVQQTQATANEQPVTQNSSNKIQLVKDQLWKIIHQQGQGDTPRKGQQISALYRGTLQDGTQFDSNQDRDSPFKFNLGQGRVIKGWDQGFASMRKGQKATLICSPDYAYGKRGSPPRIPPNSTLNFDVQLLDFQDKQKQKWQMSQQQKLAEAAKAKNQGNEAFKKGDFKEATRLYKRGIQYVEDEQSQQPQQLLKVLRLNAAQSQIKNGQYSEAIKNCTKVLEKDANNAKALYRRGVSYLKNQDFEQAQVDLQNLVKIQPKNTDAQKQLQNVKVAERAFRQKQKKVFGNMFAKATGQETKQQTPKVQQNNTQPAKTEQEAPPKSQSQKKQD